MSGANEAKFYEIFRIRRLLGGSKIPASHGPSVPDPAYGGILNPTHNLPASAPRN